MRTEPVRPPALPASDARVRADVGPSPSRAHHANAYIVSSPLQLLNALEAQRAFAPARQMLMVVESQHVIAHMKPMIASEDWDDVDLISIDARPSRLGRRFTELVGALRARRALDRVARAWSSVDRLFLGNLNNVYARHLANVVPHRSLIVLDDGTATVDIAHRRRAAVGRDRPWWANVRIGMRERLMGADGREPDRLLFFSTYDVEVGPNDTLVRNGYERLREQMTRLGVGDETLFLGQPLVETGEMLADRYLAYVRAARDHLGRAGFVYAPHRHEAHDRVERLGMELGVPVRWSDVPIEIALVRSGRLPRVLASFHSSALDNCRLIFGDIGMQIRALEIASEHLECNRAFVGRVYTYLRTHTSTSFGVDALSLSGSIDEGSILTTCDATTIRWTPSARADASRPWSRGAVSEPAMPST
jgi:hypothetical protein